MNNGPFDDKSIDDELTSPNSSLGKPRLVRSAKSGGSLLRHWLRWGPDSSLQTATVVAMCLSNSMSALINQQLEAFAQARFAGKSLTEAHYAADKSSASKLSQTF